MWALETAGYYRLSGYFYPFRSPSQPVEVDGKLERQPRLSTFAIGANFEQISALYRFDNALRLHALAGVEKLEIAVRSKIAYQLCSKHSCAHLQTELMNPKAVLLREPNGQGLRDPSHYEAWLANHDKLILRSKEDFIKHFREKYVPPIPLWVSIEVWDFGLLSYFFAAMKDSDRNAAATIYGIPRAVLMGSWLRSISHLRNICAHHSRLWNRILIDNPKAPGRDEIPELEHLRGEENTHSRIHIYGTLAIMQFMLKNAGFGAAWGDQLKVLMDKFPAAAPVATPSVMGFPDGWAEMPLWRSQPSAECSIRAKWANFFSKIKFR